MTGKCIKCQPSARLVRVRVYVYEFDETVVKQLTRHNSCQSTV